MTKRRIFTVGFSLPGDELEYVEFDSDQTLLDADIVLFKPTLGQCSFDYTQKHAGKSILSEHSSFVTKRHLDHWRSEIAAAVNAGKLVIVYLTKPSEYYRYTGEVRHSGTGRSRVSTEIVTGISTYDAVPNLRKVTPKVGSEVRMEKDGGYIAPYWSAFAGPYEVEVEGEFGRVVLRSRVGNRVVGAAVHEKSGGVLLFLPPLSYNEEAFVRSAEEGEEEGAYWTKEAIKFGKRLTSALVALADTLKQSVQTTPPPEWSLTSAYRLTAETGDGVSYLQARGRDRRVAN